MSYPVFWITWINSMSKTPRVLHIAHGIGSYNNSLRELARRLCNANFELCVASHVDLSELLDDMNLRFEHLQADQAIAERLREETHRLPGGGRLRQKFQRVSVSLRHRLNLTSAREIADLVTEWQPDVLLIDMECHVAIIQTRKLGITTVLCSRWFTVFRTGRIPPMHTTLAPPENLSDSLRVRWEWAKLALYKRWLDVRHRCSKRRFRLVDYETNARSDLQAVALGCGFSLDSIADRSHWLIPHVYRDLPVMSLTLRELEFEQANDSRMHYVGAMVDNSRNYKSTPASKRYQLFIKQRAAVGNPLIYCSYSTFWSTDFQYIEPLLDLFARRQDLDLVIGLGGKSETVNTSELPDNILVMNYAPQLEVLDNATVAITHGGISTINEALSKGVPLIVCSAGHVDQNGCMARVVHHKVGVAAISDPIDSAELERLIDGLLGEKGAEVRAQTAEMQRTMENYDKQHTAVEYLRSIAKNP